MMDTVDLENAVNEVSTLVRLSGIPDGVIFFPTPAAEYLLRLLAERYAAGWDDAMDLVGSKLAEPAPERTRYREDITR